ncbi:ribonuclease 3-like protein 2, partial [Tanacetum coccineum]
LSLLRAANISTKKLARVAVRHRLYKYVRHNAADVLSHKVREFVFVVEGEEKMVVHGGQMKAPKVLADIVESVAAAIYVDCGFNLHRMWKAIRELLEPIVMLNVLEKQPQPITTLFEICQKDEKQLEIKHWVKGDRNIASVFVDGIFLASGSSETKENAKLHAAEATLSKLTRSKSINSIVPHVKSDSNEATEIEDAKQKLHELCNKKYE